MERLHGLFKSAWRHISRRPDTINQDLSEAVLTLELYELELSLDPQATGAVSIAALGSPVQFSASGSSGGNSSVDRATVHALLESRSAWPARGSEETRTATPPRLGPLTFNGLASGSPMSRSGSLTPRRGYGQVRMRKRPILTAPASSDSSDSDSESSVNPEPSLDKSASEPYYNDGEPEFDEDPGLDSDLGSPATSSSLSVSRSKLVPRGKLAATSFDGTVSMLAQVKDLLAVKLGAHIGFGQAMDQLGPVASGRRDAALSHIVGWYTSFSFSTETIPSELRRHWAGTAHGMVPVRWISLQDVLPDKLAISTSRENFNKYTHNGTDVSMSVACVYDFVKMPYDFLPFSTIS